MTPPPVKKAPVVGGLIAQGVYGSFLAFETPTVHGLALVEGSRIDLLVVMAAVPFRGDFGRFLDELKSAYQTIGIWEIWSLPLAGMLARRGFREVTEILDGELGDGIRWDRESEPLVARAT